MKVSSQMQCTCHIRLKYSIKSNALFWVFCFNIYCWIQQMTRYSLLRDLLWRSFYFNAFCFENEFVSQECLDIYCNHERRRLCDEFIAQSLWTIFDFDVCSLISNRSIQSFQCKLRHYHIAQRDLRYRTRKSLFESFFSLKCCNWNSQRKRFWRFNLTFEKMKIWNISVVHRI